MIRLLIDFILISFLVSATHPTFAQDKCTIPDNLEQQIDQVSAELKKIETGEDQDAIKKLRQQLYDLNSFKNIAEIIKRNSKLKRTLSSNKKVYEFGEPILLKLTWTNISNETVTMDNPNPIFADILTVTNEKGQFICCIGQSHFGFQINPQEIVLKPQEHYESQFDTESYVDYDFFDLMSGKYFITLSDMSKGFTLVPTQCYWKPINTIEVEVK